MSGIIVSGWCVATVVRADLIVTLSPADVNGSTVAGAVPAGTPLVVNVLLSVDGMDNRLSDVRNLKFDFAASDAAIQLDSFRWEVEPSAYGYLSNIIPTPFAMSLSSGSSTRLIALDAIPRLVAMVNITVNASGTLNALGATGISSTSQAAFVAGFAAQSSFTLASGNLRGGILELVVSPPASSDDAAETLGAKDDAADEADETNQDDGSEPAPDQNGENGVSGDDGSPLDPAEPADGDAPDPGGSGGEVDSPSDAPSQDPSPPSTSDAGGLVTGGLPDLLGRMCGVAMLGTGICILCGIGGFRLHQRRRHSGAIARPTR